MAISEKQKDRQTENLTTSVASQVAKMPKCQHNVPPKNGKAAKVTISCLQWLIIHFNLTGFMKTYECVNINKDNHFTFSEMILTKMCIILATTYFVDFT